jgi:hypothetical protein
MFTDKLLALFIWTYTLSFRRESGQGALEYLAIVIGLVILVFALFKIFGVDIFSKGTSFLTSVFGGS